MDASDQSDHCFYSGGLGAERRLSLLSQRQRISGSWSAQSSAGDDLTESDARQHWPSLLPLLCKRDSQREGGNYVSTDISDRELQTGNRRTAAQLTMLGWEQQPGVRFHRSLAMRRGRLAAQYKSECGGSLHSAVRLLRPDSADSVVQR